MQTTTATLLLVMAIVGVVRLIRRRGAPLPVSVVVEELQRQGAYVDDATAAVEHGVRNGALVMIGETHVDAGIVRGWL